VGESEDTGQAELQHEYSPENHAWTEGFSFVQHDMILIIYYRTNMMTVGALLSDKRG